MSSVTLSPGTRLGAFEIVSALGAGGMGQVYRAHDSTLNRDVAIKILPEAFVNDPDRLARFQREAQLLASLTHANIAQVYGLERQDATTFIVMELVDGGDLAHRIAQGAMRWTEALPIVRGIVDALEAAHDKGIVHRDLKPANIALTADGQVKVLDFGLAKVEPASAASSNAPGGMSLSPTLTFAGTQMGVILGTAGYMSPEQAKGRAADKRTDVWAFGCVVFEMLTGKRAFAGEDISDTLAAILRGEPDWTALPSSVSPHVRKILTRCLDKDRRTRIPDMSVVRFLMADAPAVETSRAGGGVSRLLPWAVAAGLAVALAIAVWAPWRAESATTSHPLTRFTIAPQGALLSAAASSGPIAISPDGRRVAYVAQTESGTRLIGVRDMDRLEARMLRETEAQGTVSSAGFPFFSADGQWIGFLAGGALKKVPVDGGPVTTICSITGNWRGATWLSDDTIVLALEGPAGTGARGGGLFRVPAKGGPLAPIAPVEAGELSYRWPDALPGGKAVIFAIHRGGDSNGASIAVLRLDTRERHVVMEGGTFPRYVASGHVVFTRTGILMAAPFDLRSLKVTGASIPAVQQITMSVTTGQSQYAVSASGSLVYANLTDEGAQSLVWVDRQGIVQPINAPPQNYEHPRLSPDEQRLALDIRGYGGGATTDIWVYQFSRGTLSRLTMGGTESEAPVWTPDGARVTYAVTLQSQPPRAVAWKRMDRSDSEEQIGQGDAHLHPLQWHPSGDLLLLNESASTGSEIWMFSVKDKSLRPITNTPFKEASAGFSPDGRWLTYASDETGRFEIYVQAFPGPGGRSMISANGGVEPVWARNGRELFFREGDKMMSVPVAAGSGIPEGTPKVLFQGRFMASTSVDRWYDVSADGQRFVMLKPQDSAKSIATLTVVQGWDAELKRLTASKP